MRFHVSSLVPDHVVLRELGEFVSQERASCADALVRIAEVEARRLYAPAGYACMQAYCVGALRMSEDEANKRLRVARVARDFPAIFPALADGRLHMTGVLLLAPRLSEETADELIAAAMGQTKAAIERLLAARFPRPDVPTELAPLKSTTCAGLVAPERVVEISESADSMEPLSLADLAGPSAPSPMNAPRYPRIAPLSADRDAFQCTFRRETSELLRYAQALLSHTVPSGDLAEVIHRCLAVAVEQIEKRKFGVGSRTTTKRASGNPHYVPMHVRREVYERDGGRCTFTSDAGHRCEATTALEFDHIVPEALGGESTADNLRVRCRAHNQLAAEQAFGAGTMREKREASRARAARPVVPFAWSSA